MNGRHPSIPPNRATQEGSADFICLSFVVEKGWGREKRVSVYFFLIFWNQPGQ